MRRTILLVIGGIILIWILSRGCLVYSGCNILSYSQTNSKLDSEIYTNKVPDEYLKLLNGAKNLITDGTDISKRRNAISSFYLDKRFFLQIYKIDSVNKSSLNKIIFESFSDAPLSQDVQYKEDLNNSHFRIRYKEGPKPNVSNVYLTLSGDSTRILKKNDSIAYYYSKFKSFSIRYSQNEAEDVYSNIDEKYEGEKAALELMFLKRNGNLYFILLGAENSHDKLDPNTLYNLIFPPQ